MKNKIFNLIVVILSACIFLSFLILTKGSNLVNELKSLNIYWILAAVLCIILFWTFETLTLYTVIKTFCHKQKLFLKTIRYQMIGQFFGSITPLASGSHPAQFYAMIDNDIPAGVSGSILMIKFTIHQVVMLLYLILALLFKFNYFNTKISYFLYFCILGFIIHLAFVLLALLFSINKTMTKKVLIFIIKILSKFKIVKNVEHTYEKIEAELESFHKNATLITKHIKMYIYASSFTALQWLAFFSIPYCIYRSFGLNSSDIWTMIAAQIFLTNFMTIIPLPGAEGGAEGGFYVIYNLFFKPGTVITAILIWRVITYYLTIAIGSIFTIVIPNSKSKINKN